MRVLLSLVHIIAAVLMIIVILLQQRKQGGFSGVFGGGTQADSGQWQRFTGLTKITIGLAVVFMITSFFLVYLS
ncbi:MAG: preprotein translocase subunit SecG [Synergistaceae bacterium]|nr:preprotein translocase subunit SecG [Synergistaceae bacterium]MBQ3448729.1 preprotein translocase subunit SecG [Synergistaceae bacterium]MBQ3693210.1 preprotein translocase subunit SecG [Synergistaceae bacterium]MBQ6112429.1 preprotein translocase subunit SecG [Synergistaceae bacterium]MBQ9629642.1 preprotein translocase subunit SecG [Synergistaceae bacterium]